MKRVRTIFLGAILLLSMLYVRSLLEAFFALEAAESAENRAVRQEQLADALSWDGFFNPFARRARTLLEEDVSNSARTTDERLHALAALRRGLSSSRRILAPRSEELARLDAQERHLSSSEVSAVQPLRVPALRYEYQLLSQLGFWAWIAAVLWIIFSAFTADGRLVLRRLPVPLAACAASFGLWLFALWRA